MKYIVLLLIFSFSPVFLFAQKFYIAEIDKPIYKALKDRISYLGFNITEEKKEADFIAELVHEKKKGYMSVKSGYHKVGFMRFLGPEGKEIAKTKEQGGMAMGYNTYSALSSLFKKIMKEDFDSTIHLVAKTYVPTVKKDSSMSGSKAEELLKLKKLLDEGILTKEEFESEKKKILDA